MNFRMPEPGEGLLFGGDVQKPELVAIVNYLAPLGYKLFAANADVARHLESTCAGSLSVPVVDFPTQDKRALREVFQRYDIRGVFNLASQRGKTLMDEDYVMRRNAVDFGVPLFMEPKVSLLSRPFFSQQQAEADARQRDAQTAELFARCMSEKLPARKEGVIPAEVRRWGDFIGG